MTQAERIIAELVGEAIRTGEADQMVMILRDAMRRARNAGTARKTVDDFYRAHGHQMSIPERRLIGHVMREVDEQNLRPSTKRWADDLADRLGAERFV
jgi:hypothetical protein